MLLDYSINIISIFLILIIIYSILCSSINLNKYEKFENKINKNYEDIYNKCPRGCGHHYSVPNCNECSKDKKDYNIGTKKDNEWIDKYHIKGDKNEIFITNIMNKWYNINPNVKFTYKFLKKDFYEKKIYEVNLHPHYLINIFEKYNPEKNSSNIYIVSKWTENIKEDLNKYSNIEVINKIIDLKYLDIEPEEWIDKRIYEILMTNRNVSDEYLKTLSIEELNKYDINIDINIKTSKKNILNINEIKKYLEKIFNACDINKDGIISNGEELRYLYLSTNNYIKNKYDNDNEKYENELLNEINKIYNIKQFNNKIKKNNISNIWNDIYNKEKINKKLIISLCKKNYIDKILLYIYEDSNNNIDKINYITNIIVYSIKYLEKNNLIDINDNKINNIYKINKYGNENDNNYNEYLLTNYSKEYIKKIIEINNKNEECIDNSENEEEDEYENEEYNEESEENIYSEESREKENIEDDKEDDEEDDEYIDEKENNKELLYNIGIKNEDKKELFKNAENRFKILDIDYNKYKKGDISLEEFIDISVIKRMKDIENGRGLHIDNLIWLFKLKKKEAINYVKKLKKEIEKRRIIIENKKKELLTENKYIKMEYKIECNDKKNNINIPLKKEKDKYNFYWPEKIDKECKEIF